MVDYDRSIGTNGTMRIRDTGTKIEFWLYSSSPYTWASSLPWGYTINGSTGSGTSSWPQGTSSKRLGSWTVNSTQTVTFRLGVSGTESFGGPHTFSRTIDRGAKPSPPSTPTLNPLSNTSVEVIFQDGNTGGSPIVERQILYGTSPDAYQKWVDSDGSTVITGLLSARTYYFWARTKNAQGWSAFSPRASTSMFGGARVQTAAIFKQALPYVNVNGVWRLARPYVNVNGVWKETV